LSVYKPCDIRGRYPSELSPELYRSWGRALGREVKEGSKFVVGGDVRRSTQELLASLIEGLSQSPIDVVDLGEQPTPIVYYSKRRLKASGCAIVTASHNPPEFNGLKWMLGEMPPTAAEVELLESEAQEAWNGGSSHANGSVRSLDMASDYVAWLQETWVENMAAQNQIVLDPRHGCWAGKARQYLQAIFPSVIFSAIHDTPDAGFGGLSPDCSQPELLNQLGREVDRQRAQLGIAFDGDGDRVAFVDEGGVALSAEETTNILLQSFGPGLENEPFVYDLKFSDQIAKAATQLGGTPLAERSGHAFIRRRMLESGAAFGAEVSGHYFFRAIAAGDDGLFTACWLIDYLACTGRTLGQLRAHCPRVFVTPDLRIPVDPEIRSEVISRVRSTWSKYPQSSVDGVRVDFPDGWALVRSSQTEPAMTFRFEGRDADGLHHLVEKFCYALPEMGDAVWQEYENSL
jgi:phosphomannomutase/phosphoglucomutase